MKFGVYDMRPFEVVHASMVRCAWKPQMISEDQLLLIQQMDLAFTGFCNGKAEGWAGVYPLHSGVVEAFSFISEEARSKPLSMFKAVYKTLELLQTRFNFHRAQMNVETGFLAGYRLAEHLGFEKECIMQWYGPDRKNYTRFVKLWTP